MDKTYVYNFIINFLITVAGTMLGGIVTLIVNKKFEIARLRINNINEMSKEIIPLLQRYVGVLNTVCEFLEANEYREEIYKQDDLINALRTHLNELNLAVNIYEVELSNMLDFYDNLLVENEKFIEEFSSIDIINSERSYYYRFMMWIEKNRDMVVTFSEEISELKLEMLNGRYKKYWKKDIYKEEKKTRINYHTK